MLLDRYIKCHWTGISNGTGHVYQMVLDRYIKNGTGQVYQMVLDRNIQFFLTGISDGTVHVYKMVLGRYSTSTCLSSVMQGKARLAQLLQSSQW